MFFEMNLGGGDTSIDLYNPDEVIQANLSASGTSSVSVTQKPRWIVWEQHANSSSSGTNGQGSLGIADCKNETLKLYLFNGSSYVVNTSISFASRIPTCSDSIVTIKGNGSYATRNNVAIYY